MINPPIMPFGPWSPGVTEYDRRAGLRAICALCAAYCGSDHPVVTTLRLAERVPDMMGQALDEFDRLPALRRRRIVGTYAAVMRPLQGENSP
jgi:hypothetical protein